jgi:hypothetical protein
MDSAECGSDEDVIRAILRAHWDPENRRINSDLFKVNTSVSRLSILPIERLIEIFKGDFDHRSIGPLDLTGRINVGRLKQIGASYENSPQALTVTPKPTADNIAHAEIPQKISKGLSKVLIRSLDLRDLNGNEVLLRAEIPQEKLPPANGPSHGEGGFT